jgi:CheY-like chemotaxis protein
MFLHHSYRQRWPDVPATVLCIDDDERALFIRTKILERFEYRVLTATSAEDGLRLFAQEAPDVVVLDYFMPGMSGAQVAWELKRRGSTVPILMLSSAVFVPEDARDLVDAFCAKIDGPTRFLDLLQHMTEEAQKRGGAQQHSILHVDGNDASRYPVARMLRRAGFRVLEAASGEEALKLALSQPALVLLGTNLPDMNGFEVCRRLKTNPATALIAVLHLASTAPDPEQEAHADGVETFLVLPLEAEQLTAAISAFLARRNAD